jgi:pimeloyl-ACP methyl ester carboxylesterase
MSEIHTRHVLIEGVRGLLRSSGPEADDEAVVFVHGNPGSGEDFLDLLNHTGEFVRAIAPDMPGYGRSERPRDFPYTVPGYAHYLDALLDQLGVERAHLVLHDFGGPWGLQWAADHPGRVASLSLLNVGILPGYRWHEIARVLQTPWLGEAFLLAGNPTLWKLLFNAYNPRPLPDAFLERMIDEADWGLKRAMLALYRATPDLSALGERQAQALRQLNLPALVLWGDRDRFLPVRFAELQSQYFRTQTHILEGCGHWPMIEEPERVRDYVIGFLRQQLDLSGPSTSVGVSA